MSKLKPQNLLILFCDQHNPEITGCYGNSIVHTPNIESLAAKGTVFTSAYTATPLCVPARAAMATGNYPFANGFWDNAHPYSGEQLSWGKRLTEEGISVTAIGKLHFKDDTAQTFPGQRIALNVSGGVGDLMTACRTGKGSTPALRKQLLNAGEGDSDYLHYDAAIARTAAAYLKEEAPKETAPWCLYVGFTTPHYPLKVPEELLDLYRPFSQFPVPEEWNQPELLHPALRQYRETIELDKDITAEQLQRAIAAYYAMVTFMDRQVGVVLQALKEAGLEENTRIIYCDDHGDSAGDHGLFFKSTMNEGSVRIPLIAAGPDIPAGKRVDSCVSIVDLYSTILDCMGMEPTGEERKLPGVSLFETISQAEAGTAGASDSQPLTGRAVFSEYHAAGFKRSVFMVRKGIYKLVRYMGYEEPQLFNLARDPKERDNLAGREEYSGILKDLMKELENICNTEDVDLRSLEDQKDLMESMGGAAAIEKKGLTPFSAVPEGLGMR